MESTRKYCYEVVASLQSVLNERQLIITNCDIQGMPMAVLRDEAEVTELSDAKPVCQLN